MYFSRYRHDVLALFLSTLLPLTSPVLADARGASPANSAAPTGQAVIVGSVHDGTGAPVQDAHVIVSGPVTITATTDQNGSFRVAIGAGLYNVSITKAGFNLVALREFAAVADTTTPLDATLTKADLSSLQSIGRVTSSQRGAAINTGPAATNFLSGSTIADFGSPQINDVLAHLPGVNIQQMSGDPDRTIIVGGVQPYETQVLIDGHPIALGQYGVWSSAYFPSFLLGGIETESGPGNTTPFANLAVGGTANLVTQGFSAKPTGELNYGFDNYGSEYSSLLATGKVGNLSYVVNAGSSGLNTPLSHVDKCQAVADTMNPGYGIVSECANAQGNIFQKGEALKLRYDFNPTTSLQLGFVGAWSGFHLVGTSFGTYNGQLTIEPCEKNGLLCSNPDYSYLYGTSVQGYAWYNGTPNYNNQGLYDAQFSKAIGNTTLLVRPYLGDITNMSMGQPQGDYPAFFGPPGSYTYGNGVTPPASFINGLYTGATGTPTEQACAAAYDDVTSPTGTITVKNNQFQCYGGPYSTFEQDKLYGSTFSLLQPFGQDDVAELNYDFHGQSTYAYVFTPADVSVPFSTARYSTFSLTGQIHLTSTLKTNIGLYDTGWTVTGVALADPSDTTSTALAGLDRSVAHFDPHIAFVDQPNPRTALRLSTGTSTTFPYVGQVSGLAAYDSPSCSIGAPFWNGGLLTKKNPNLQPETSIAYDAGTDLRLAPSSLLSIDLQQTIVHGVFEQLTTAIPSSLPALCGGTSEEGILTPVNVAKLAANSIILKYAYTPRRGFGFNIAATAESAILSGLPANVFTPGTASVPANDVQICGNGVTAPGIATCIPYLQGYAQFTWTQPRDAVALGVNYEGKNNAYFQPPFAILDLSVKHRVSRNATLALSVQNLLNTNNYGIYVPIVGAGTPLVGNTTNAAYSEVSQTSYPTNLIPASPRYLRLELRLHPGRT